MAEQLNIEKDKSGLVGKLSKVWIIPAIAVIFGLFLAYDQYRNRDIEISIIFPNAESIVVGKTKLKFQRVDVGLVKGIEFSENLDQIEVQVSVDREIAQYIDQDAQFWLVKPEISISGVSGLDTLLKGDFINGVWDNIKNGKRREFVALEEPSLIERGEAGTFVKIIAEDGKSLLKGSPLYHKGISVGLINKVDLAKDGNFVEIEVFVRSPYDALMNTGTRFWNASGLDINLGTDGLEVELSSIASFVRGGIEFATIHSGGDTLSGNMVFDLYRSRKLATESLFEEDIRGAVALTSRFEGTVKGLKVGSPVEFLGLKVGEVESISAVPREADGKLELAVSYTIQPARMGLTAFQSQQDTYDFLANSVVANGLRSRLTTQSLLGGLLVELFEDPEATSAILARNGASIPRMPSVPTAPDTLSVAAENVFKRVANLPIEDVLNNLTRLTANLNVTLTSASVQSAPKEIVDLLKASRAIVEGEELRTVLTQAQQSLQNINQLTANKNLQTLPDNLHKLVMNVDALLTSDDVQVIPSTLVTALTALSDQLVVFRDEKLVEQLSSILSNTNNAADSLSTLLSEDASKQILPLTAKVLGHVNTLVSDDDLQTLPTDVRQVLKTVQGQLDILSEGQIIQNTENAIKDVRLLLANASGITEQVAPILTQTENFTKKLGELPADQLAKQADELMAAISSFITLPATEALPTELNGALEQLRLLLKDLRDGGATKNINTTLASTRDAMVSIQEAAEELPTLVARLEVLSNTAQLALEGFSPASPLYGKVSSTVDDVDKAVRSLRTFLRIIERKPNAILTGK